jgi:flagellar biosynthesis GTPase FlhF
MEAPLPPPAEGAGPAELLLLVEYGSDWLLCPEALPCREVCLTGLLAATNCSARFGDAARVCLSTDSTVAARERGEGVQMALLREVLLGKAELPGFGMLPSGWVPEAVRRATLVHHMICTAATPEAVLRVFVHAGRAPPDSDEVAVAAAMQSAIYGVGATAFERLDVLLTAGAPFAPREVSSAHDLAMAVLTSPAAPQRLTKAALGLLGALARWGAAGDEQRLPLDVATDLMPHVVAAAATPEALGATRARAGAASWLHRWLLECSTDDPNCTLHAPPLIAAGGAALAANIMRAELDHAVALAASREAWGGAITVSYAVRLLVVCLIADVHASLLAAGGLQALTRTLLLAMERATAGSCMTASDSASVHFFMMSVLATVLLPGVEAPLFEAGALTDSLAAVAAARVLEDAVAALRNDDADPSNKQYVGARVWSGCLTHAHAWPGGGAATLAARADAAGVAAALTQAVTMLRRRRNEHARIPVAIAEVQTAQRLLRTLTDEVRGVDAARAAEALLAEEAATADAATRKAAARKASADARRAAAAAEKAAAAEQAAAAQAAVQAAQAAQAAEAAARRAERQAAAQAARAEAEAAANAAAAAAEAQRQQAAQAAAQRAARRDAAAAQAAQAAAAATRARVQQSGASAVRDTQHGPQPPEPEMQRASDALIGELFPWMRLHDDDKSADTIAAPRAQSSAAAAAAGGAGSDDGDDGSCVICLDAARTTALVPCGHALLCASCAAKVLATMARACPVCRSTATSSRQVAAA